MYYGVNENDGHGGGASEQTNPLDIDSSGFKVDQYMEKMLKELSLTDLYDRERKVKKGEWVLPFMGVATDVAPLRFQRRFNWIATCSIWCTKITRSSSKHPRPLKR